MPPIKFTVSERYTLLAISSFLDGEIMSLYSRYIMCARFLLISIHFLLIL